MALAVVVACALLNIAGVKVVSLTSLWLFFALSAPFVAIVVLAPFKMGALAHAVTKPTDVDRRHSRRPAHLHVELHGMGQCLDHRDRSRAAAADVPPRHAGRSLHRCRQLHRSCRGHVDDRLTSTAWETGSWADIARPDRRTAASHRRRLGGMISAFGMFNALVMSYSRLPLAMAQDGMLPKAFGKLHQKSRAPWVAISALGDRMGACASALGFARLVTLDIMLYGASLFLEFMALAVLRFREPDLNRPFRVPGGLFGAIADRDSSDAAARILRHPQRARIDSGNEFVRLRDDPDRGGFVAYFLNHLLKPAGWSVPASKNPQPAA